jgi:hypothetical protein
VTNRFGVHRVGGIRAGSWRQSDRTVFQPAVCSEVCRKTSTVPEPPISRSRLHSSGAISSRRRINRSRARAWSTSNSAQLASDFPPSRAAPRHLLGLGSARSTSAPTTRNCAARFDVIDLTNIQRNTLRDGARVPAAGRRRRLNQIVVSDLETLEGLTQFRFRRDTRVSKRLERQDLSNRICVKGGFALS